MCHVFSHVLWRATTEIKHSVHNLARGVPNGSLSVCAPPPPVLGAWAPGPQNKIFCVFEVLAWVPPTHLGIHTQNAVNEHCDVWCNRRKNPQSLWKTSTAQETSKSVSSCFS